MSVARVPFSACFRPSNPTAAAAAAAAGGGLVGASFDLNPCPHPCIALPQ
ncbi:hypothetical protein GW17_00013209 [Ensete ventricosum]|uniref:Uncharacterized protein n=1 Tax=Ensete ventricosum TaxID=4639 RepID=A0A426YNW9_ENSVE|nr:hypothetical protein B296_00036051 [Ensete ventricosum]RWW22584.1 hypothetical protein GW17_00013209 [Ensete ventricosum]